MKKLYEGFGQRPMRIVFFSSGGPGNFDAACDLASEFPSILSVELLVCDRLDTASARSARTRGMRVAEFDYEAEFRASGYHPEQRRSFSKLFHNEVLRHIIDCERADGCGMDLAVLAYRRLIQGDLLTYFDSRMINQHPADLAVLGEDGGRLLTGIGGHHRALEMGLGGGRTSTIIVREGTDTGEIICRGPFVSFDGQTDDRKAMDAHENRQKIESDWPSLRFALMAIATGKLQLGQDTPFVNLFMDGVPLPAGGRLVERECYRDLLEL